MRPKLSLILAAIFFICVLPHARADDSEKLGRALAFSHEFMFEKHFSARVTLESRDSGRVEDQFTYDRYPDVERIKTNNGNVFARKNDGTWLKSDDWAKTGAAASSNDSSHLDSRVIIAKVAWNTNNTSYDKSQGADVVKLVSHTKDENGEHFVFERTREHPKKTTYPEYTFTDYDSAPGGEPLLEKFSGPVMLGDQKLFLTVHYTGFVELKNAKSEIIRSPAKKGPH
jgi:hypothetical protein